MIQIVTRIERNSRRPVLDREIEEAVSLDNVDLRYVQFFMRKSHRAEVDLEKNWAARHVYIYSQRAEV